MCKFSSKSGGVPFQPLGDLTWNDPITEFLSKILLVPEDCASSGLSQDPSNKKTIYLL